MGCPASAGRPRFDMAEIVRRHRAVLETEEQLTLTQRRVLSAIELCRTAALGGHIDVCRACDYERPAYNSCRNRHCPKCQALAQEKWIAARSERLLPVPHFHVVFTMPSELRALARYRPAAIFDALFAAASETLLELGQSKLEAQIGVTMVLHTWTRDLRFHPHVHALVTAGGLARDNSCWTSSNAKYLFPVKVMATLLRGKMMHALRALNARGEFEGFGDFRDPEGFDRLMSRLARMNWIVYAKKPFQRVDHVLQYLGRYTHRVAISNSRLVNVTVDEVTLRTKSGKTVTLPPLEFLRRFVQHVLPSRFHKIRHCGLYAGSHSTALSDARALLEETSPSGEKPAPTGWQERLRELTGRDVECCPLCGEKLAHLAVPHPTSRAPPKPVAA